MIKDAKIPCSADCPDRNYECHAICQKYKDYNREHNKYKDFINSKRKEVNLFSEYAAARSISLNSQKYRSSKNR